MIEKIRVELKKHFDQGLVDELLAAYEDAKKNSYLGGLRLSAVEGGRFCEAAFRMLQQATTGTFTPLSSSLNTDQLLKQLETLPKTNYSDSLRLHIPRGLRVVYDIRNSRDVAHLGDGIDPNRQDSTLVISVLDWVLAEFIRLYHTVSADKAQVIVENLVKRHAPVIQDFNGFLKVLNSSLGASDFVLVLLYQCGKEGASYDQLYQWVLPKMRKNLKRTLNRLINDRAELHFDGSQYFITDSGMTTVEHKRLYEPLQPKS